jgi:FSR family fosmidomycin resistance protein-like MFS transporter
MSLYTVAGSFGWGLGPLVAVALLAWFGPRGSALLIVPGSVAAILLYRQMGMVERMRQARVAAAPPAAGRERPAWGELVRVMLVTMLRFWAFNAVVQFVPIWYSEMGYGPAFYGPLTALIILAGCVGTLVGGVLADRVGPRRVVVTSLSLLIPALLLFLGFPGPLAFVTGMVAGMLADASLSVTLVMAQQLVPGRVGVTSGLILGLGFVTGGIGVPVTGRIADAVGMQAALLSLIGLVVLAVGLALTLPSDRVRFDRRLSPVAR